MGRHGRRTHRAVCAQRQSDRVMADAKSFPTRTPITLGAHQPPSRLRWYAATNFGSGGIGLKKSRVFAGGIGLLLAILTASAGSGFRSSVEAQASEKVTPPMVSVEVDEKGAAGGVVFAELLSRPGSDAQPFRIPRSAVDVHGTQVDIRLPPQDVPSRYLDSNMLVTVGVHVINEARGAAGSWFASVRLVQLGEGAYWQDPAARVATSENVHAFRSGSRGLPVNRAVLSGRVAFTSATTELPGVARRATADMVALDDPSDDPSFPREHCRTIRTRVRPATVGTSYPAKGTRSWLTYSARSSSSFGVAVSYNKGASFSASGTRTAGDEWGQNFAKSKRNRSYRVSVLYKRIDCRLSYPGKWKQGKEMYRRWTPDSQTGGTSVHVLKSAPAHFKKCARVARGTWWRGRTRGSDYSFGAGVKFKGVIGIDLYSRRAYTNGARLYYSNTKRRMKLCGNNGYPAKASKIRER